MLSRGRHLNGDCATDIAVLRTQLGCQQGASDPTLSPLVASLAGNVDAVLDAIGRPRLGVGAGVKLGGAGLEDVSKFVTSAARLRETGG